MKIIKAVVVYQAGIANVFEVENFDAEASGRGNCRRLLQHAFGPCEWFARGLRSAGTHIASAHCNRAGDITDAKWDFDLTEAVFREAMMPVETHQPAHA
jgi:hypothetical protein